MEHLVFSVFRVIVGDAVSVAALFQQLLISPDIFLQLFHQIIVPFFFSKDMVLEVSNRLKMLIRLIEILEIHLIEVHDYI